MIANKHLEACTEECKYNSSGICVFSLRNKFGCFLDPEVQNKASDLLANALRINSIQMMKMIIKGKF